MMSKLPEKKNIGPEQSCILRVPENLVPAIESILDHKSVATIHLEIYKGGFSLIKHGERVYRGVLAQLPNIVESFKTFDNSVFYKAGNPTQVLLVEGGELPSEKKYYKELSELNVKVHDEVSVKNSLQAELGFAHVVDSKQLISGLAPPLRHIAYSHYDWEMDPDSDVVRHTEEALVQVEADDVYKVVYELVNQEEAVQAQKVINEGLNDNIFGFNNYPPGNRPIAKLSRKSMGMGGSHTSKLNTTTSQAAGINSVGSATHLSSHVTPNSTSTYQNPFGSSTPSHFMGHSPFPSSVPSTSTSHPFSAFSANSNDISKSSKFDPKKPFTSIGNGSVSQFDGGSTPFGGQSGGFGSFTDSVGTSNPFNLKTPLPPHLAFTPFTPGVGDPDDGPVNPLDMTLETLGSPIAPTITSTTEATEATSGIGGKDNSSWELNFDQDLEQDKVTYDTMVDDDLSLSLNFDPSLELDMIDSIDPSLSLGLDDIPVDSLGLDTDLGLGVDLGLGLDIDLSLGDLDKNLVETDSSMTDGIPELGDMEVVQSIVVEENIEDNKEKMEFDRKREEIISKIEQNKTLITSSKNVILTKRYKQALSDAETELENLLKANPQYQ